MPKTKTGRLLERERFELSAKSGGGILQYEVWGYQEKGKTIVTRYNLAYINPTIYAGDNGRVLGYDNAHGHHHRHYMGGMAGFDEKNTREETMTTLLIRTDSVDNFFSRARNAALKADSGDNFYEKITITFEDPQQMFMVLSVARRRIMIEVMKKPQTIRDLVHNLNRNRSTIVKDIRFLEQKGLLIRQKSSAESNDGEKIIKSVAPRIELVAMLG